MVALFPVLPVFPQPTWVEMPAISAPAVLESTFLNGGRSRLQISDAMYGAELKCEWQVMTYADMIRFWPFWSEVNTSESFELPDKFWPPLLPEARKTLYLKTNPSGLWQFKDKPVLDDRSVDQPILIATLLGVLN